MSRKHERGAVALEYILIAALIALALVGSFIFLRQRMTDAIVEEGEALTQTVTSSIAEGQVVPEGTK